MSLDVVNTAVVIPHQPDWVDRVRWQRRWDTGVVGALQGQEDRASRRVNPLHTVEFSHLALSVEERSLMEQRIMAALKAGRAVVPFWGRPSYLNGNADRTSAVLESGRWPWAANDYVFFIGRTGMPILNRSLGIDSGGYGATGWVYDQFYSGGSPITTAETPITGAVTNPAPDTIYQSAREQLIEWPGRYGVPWPQIVYQISGLTPGLPCRLRLHYLNWPQSGYSTDVTIDVQGETLTSTGGNLSTLTGGVDWTAYVFDLTVIPSTSGVINITLGTNSTVWNGTVSRRRTYICGVELHQYAWELRQISSVAGQTVSWTTPLNGIYLDGAAVYPAIWGRPSVDDVSAITDYHGRARLRVEEPLPEVELAQPGWAGEEDIPIWDADASPGGTTGLSRSSAAGSVTRLGSGSTSGTSRSYASGSIDAWTLEGDFSMGVVTGIDDATLIEHTGKIWTTAADPAELDADVRAAWEADAVAKYLEWCDDNGYVDISHTVVWQEPSHQGLTEYWNGGYWYQDIKSWEDAAGFFIWPIVQYTVGR